jgi:GTP cyclohydrolase I/GTP cyclohydrolase-4
VGVTNVEKVIRIGARREQLYYAKLDCFVDLGPKQKGAHMSRFEEVVNDVIGEVVLGESGFKAEQLAQHMAEQVRERQDALRAEVTIAARYPEHKPAPGLGHPDAGDLHALRLALASERGTRRPRRRRRPGHDRVPVRAADRRRALARAPHSRRLHRRRDRAHLRRGPVATHNQRGLGTLYVGCPEGCDTEIEAAELLRSSRTRCRARSTS